MNQPPRTRNADADRIGALIAHEIDHVMDQALADRRTPDPRMRDTLAAFHTGQLMALARIRTLLEPTPDRAAPGTGPQPNPHDHTRKEPT